MNKILTIILVIITIFILLMIIQSISSKPLFEQYHYNRFVIDDDEDFFNIAGKDPSQFIENVNLSQQEKAQRQQDYTKVIKTIPKCNGRCTCCLSIDMSQDRIKACSKMYNKGPKFEECIKYPSKYANKACTSMYGSGG